MTRDCGQSRHGYTADMSSELTIEGVEYISSKRASEITGYSQDYVGQLARAGKILGKRVGGLWYVVADSLSGYKEVADTYTPTPPVVGQPKTAEDSSIITFEGKTYVSAARAAKLTSYHQDYIGQLARGGKILSRQIGKRWYIDIEALREHKNEKDALLGAVQSSSVGLNKSEVGEKEAGNTVNSSDPYDVGLHYTYKAEANALLPLIKDKPESKMESNTFPESEPENRIPIRVVRPTIIPPVPTKISEYRKKKVSGRISVLSIFSKTFPVFAIGLLAVIVYNFSPTSASISSLKTSPAFQKWSASSLPKIESISRLAERVLSKEIHYSR